MIENNKLTQWVRLEIYKEHKDGRVKNFLVRHIANGKLGSEILELGVPETPDEHWPIEALNEIQTHIEMDANGLGGMQAYCILSFREKSGPKSTGRFTYRVNVDEDMDEITSSEPPTKSGIVAQCMRHTESMMRSTNLAIGQVIANQMRAIERLSIDNDKLQERQSRVFELLEELQERKHERDLEQRQLEFKQRVSEEMVDKVGMLLPAVANKLIGKPLLTEKTTPMNESVKNFLTSLNDSQMETIMNSLSIEQRILLGSVIEVLPGESKH